MNTSPVHKLELHLSTDSFISWISGSESYVKKEASDNHFSHADQPRTPDPIHVCPPSSLAWISSDRLTTTKLRQAPDLKLQTGITPTRAPSHHTPLTPSPFLAATRRFGRVQSPIEAGPSYALRTPTTPSRLANNLWKAGTSLYHAASRASTPAQPSAPPVSLETLIECLTPLHQAFLQTLDSELEKVERFYTLRQREASTHGAKLRQQTAAFCVHRDLYIANRLCDHGRGWLGLMKALSTMLSSLVPSSSRPSLIASVVAPARLDRELGYEESKNIEAQDEPRVTAVIQHRLGDYNRAQRKLKRMLREHYRVLEALNNYRILNLMGFRKTLEKFDEAIKAPMQLRDTYMRERIEPCTFAQGQDVRQMMTDIEQQFATCFCEGNSKTALVDLRLRSPHAAHHLSLFSTGALLGLAIPALALGAYQSFQPYIRTSIHGWDALLFIYGVLLVPVMLLLLLGTNILIWARLRINYVFIFELDPRHIQDRRKYFELPALLFATLCYSFCLSFVGPDRVDVSPHIWPIVWLLFASAATFNPLPITNRSGRFWFARNVARLIKTGWNKVRFTEFWLSAQFASLAFTLGNLYFVACSYHVGFEQDTMATCSQNRAWAVPAALSALPFMIRFVQCMRRQIDTGKTRHLWNAVKYCVGVAQYFMYYWWRSGGAKFGTSFVLYCLTATLFAIGSSAWEFIIDWSILRPHARYPPLRDDLLYPLPVYYFALVFNLAARFSWVCYIPGGGPSFALRTWLVAVVEVFRRWQWNLLRLESEHLGNMDSYRIMRELPMFYAPDEMVPGAT